MTGISPQSPAVDISLSMEERRSARRVLRKMASEDRVARGLSLQELLTRWTRFVTEVEAGYQWTIYEYADDLSVRDILQEIIDQGAESLRGKLTAWLKPWDDRFMSATRPVVNPLDPNDPPAALARISRVPRKLVAELESDLNAEGIR